MCKGPAPGSLQTWGCCLGAGGATPQPGPEQQGWGLCQPIPWGQRTEEQGPVRTLGKRGLHEALLL